MMLLLKHYSSFPLFIYKKESVLKSQCSYCATKTIDYSIMLNGNIDCLKMFFDETEFSLPD